jgi:hypothetical protein
LNTLTRRLKAAAPTTIQSRGYVSVHDEHDDPMNTKRITRIRREHRVIVHIALLRDDIFMKRLLVNAAA